MRLRLLSPISLLLAAASALTALPAMAQTALQPGMIVNLKGPSNRWLTATPGGTVVFTTNVTPSTWEEWLYGNDSNGAPYFESHYGKRLMLTSNRGSVIAQPVTGSEWDSGLVFLFSFDAAGKVVSAPVLGGKVVIGLVPLNPNVRDTLGLLDGATAPGTRSYWSMSAEDAKKYFPPWTIVQVASPTPGRAAKQIGLQDLSGYALRSTHGTFLSLPGTSALPVTASHAATKNTIQARQAGNPGWPITFGQVVTLNYQMSTKAASVQPGTGLVSGLPNVIWSDTRFSSVDQWTLVDPTGEHPAGMRVPVGAPVCLISNGKALSASNSISALYMSSNGCTRGGTWEQWSFVR